MKCIKCGTDNKLKDRTAWRGRCLRCGHPFVFEPTAMRDFKITDPLFSKAIADISVNDTLFFTPRQLFYLLDQRSRLRISNGLNVPAYIFINIFWGFLFGFAAAILSELNVFIFGMLAVNIVLLLLTFSDIRSSKYLYQERQNFARSLQIWGGIVTINGLISSLLLNSSMQFLCSSAFGLLSIFLGSLKVPKITKEVIITYSLFQDWINKWTEINSSIAKMLPSPRDTNENAAINPDVSAYSFDRVVVCDRAEIAQFLIANKFHFENNCAVLSVTGYPQNIFDTTMQMLRRNPDLKVYALHDCSPRGIGLVNHLRTSHNWFPDNSTIIIDIGLLPRQIMVAGSNMFVLNSESSARDARELPSGIRQDFSSEELQWLESGNYVELESFSPQKIIQILNLGIAGSRDLDSDDSGLILVGDAGSSIYVVDSFG
ncbi:MAG: hypothetical protein MUE44_16505 [Oscillatoriaceae cyanobacterium Prado104]|nr:hypothetical protein [Oscillatoriaceae cyanobacterium Prado104]